MAPIAEFFGFDPEDSSPRAASYRDARRCPFLEAPCVKVSNGVALGTCTKSRSDGDPVIICPKRFHAEGEAVVEIIAREAVPGRRLAVVPEVPVGRPLGRMDWVLAEVNADGKVQGRMYGVEAQAVDTTGSLKPYVEAYFTNGTWLGVEHASGINWRNVWKRIVPQILAKGRLYEAFGTKLFVVMQDVLVDYLRDDLRLEPARRGEAPNVVFYSFRLVRATRANGYELVVRERFETTLRRIEYAVGDVAALPSQAEVARAVELRLRETGSPNRGS